MGNAYSNVMMAYIRKLSLLFRNVFQAIYKDEYDKINELYFKCSCASRINKLRDTAIE